ncbi:MAG: hypothetical protein M3R17_00585 [Bacteroidota bacterium]|nr:hypothetical protein [Bacteroidota bacterium]
MVSKAFGYSWYASIEEIRSAMLQSPFIKEEGEVGWDEDREEEKYFTAEQVEELISIFEKSLAKMKEISYPPEKGHIVLPEYDHLWPDVKFEYAYSMSTDTGKGPVRLRYAVKCPQLTIDYLKFMLSKGREITFD